jgi:hypothetical protein
MQWTANLGWRRERGGPTHQSAQKAAKGRNEGRTETIYMVWIYVPATCICLNQKPNTHSLNKHFERYNDSLLDFEFSKGNSVTQNILVVPRSICEQVWFQVCQWMLWGGPSNQKLYSRCKAVLWGMGEVSSPQVGKAGRSLLCSGLFLMDE